MEHRVKAAAIYCRISQDRDGSALGVQRQEALCRKLAERKGWPVAEVYVDNDVTAYSGKVRPRYETMLGAIETGLIDAVLVVDADRLTRQPAELERFIELADRCGTALANAAGDLDLSSSDGRFRARIMGAVARQESEKKAERLRRERAQRASHGRPHPGPRAFGFEPDNVTICDSEAAMIRAAARAVLAGRSIRSVADAWNDAGASTSRGNRWTVNAVREILTSARTAGLRLHQGEVIGEGAWPAILPRDMWERLVALCRARKRPAGRPPTRLLSGIVVCGRCGGPMRSSGGKRAEKIYACRTDSGYPGACGRLSVNADHLDVEIRDRVVATLATRKLSAAVASHGRDEDQRALVAALEADEAALVALAADHYVHRIIGKAEFLHVRQQLDRRIASAKAHLATNGGGSVLDGLPPDGDGLRAWWDVAPSDLRRAVVETVIEHVDIAPLDPSRPRRFDPNRARVRWRA